MLKALLFIFTLSCLVALIEQNFCNMHVKEKYVTFNRLLNGIEKNETLCKNVLKIKIHIQNSTNPQLGKYYHEICDNLLLEKYKILQEKEQFINDNSIEFNKIYILDIIQNYFYYTMMFYICFIFFYVLVKFSY